MYRHFCLESTFGNSHAPTVSIAIAVVQASAENRDSLEDSANETKSLRVNMMQQNVARAFFLFQIQPSYARARHTCALPMDKFNPDLYLSQLRKCRHLPESSMKHLCLTVRAILMEESNVQPISSPVTVCGDIHGQLWDLLELFKIAGDCPATSYVFMVGLHTS